MSILIEKDNRPGCPPKHLQAILKKFVTIITLNKDFLIWYI